MRTSRFFFLVACLHTTPTRYFQAGKQGSYSGSNTGSSDANSGSATKYATYAPSKGTVTFGSVDPSIPELRSLLTQQLSANAPRMESVNTETNLIVQLSRSNIAEERLESLERGEALWEELHEANSPLPLTSRSTVKMSLCSAMRRCALVSRQRGLAELWTQRFAERVSSLSPKDFMEEPILDGKVLGWREARAKARPGTGIDEDDVEADRRDEEEERRSKEGNGRKEAKKKETPIQAFRNEVLMDHPTVQVAFRRQPGPGPRYTG